MYQLRLLVDDGTGEDTSSYADVQTKDTRKQERLVCCEKWKRCASNNTKGICIRNERIWLWLGKQITLKMALPKL